MTIGQKKLKFAKEQKREHDMAKHIPWTHLADKHTVATKDGMLMQTLLVNGHCFETADQSETNQLKHLRETLFRSIASPDVAIYHHIVRRKIKAYPSGIIENEFCDNLDQAYNDELDHRTMFTNEQYVTVVLRPTKGTQGLIEEMYYSVTSLFKKRDEKAYRDLSEALKRINDVTTKVERTLHGYGLRKLGLVEVGTGTYYSDQLSFYQFLVSGEMLPVQVALTPLDEYICNKQILIGHETLEMRGVTEDKTRRAGLLSIKTYSHETSPSALDLLLTVQAEFVVSQSMTFMGANQSREHIIRVMRQYANTEEGSESILDDLGIALAEVTNGETLLGNHHMTIMGFGENNTALRDVLGDLSDCLSKQGIIATRESIGLQGAFLAQLPGNMDYIARKAPITTKNFSSFMSLHTFPSGAINGSCWGEAVSVLETTSGTPYWFSFHDADVGNFTAIGPTGAGKTALVNFLIAQSQRVNPRTVLFDKDRGSEIFVRAVDGDYLVVKNGVPTGFNPLQIEDSPENRAFLRDWIRLLASTDTDLKPTPAVNAIIKDSIDAIYDLPKSDRNLGNLCKLYAGFEDQDGTSLFERMIRWHGQGESAWLFDNLEDTLELNAKTIGFDLTTILDDSTHRTPWLFYVFHRLQQLIDKERTMVIVDEGWKALNDPIFREVLKDLFKTIRKREGLVGFATQDVADIANSSIASTIIGQCRTQIFLPDPKARREIYCDLFNLSERELHVVRKQISNVNRCFLVRHGQDSVIARLDLGNLKEYLSVLSAKNSTLKEMDNLRQTIGNKASQWLPAFMENNK